MSMAKLRNALIKRLAGKPFQCQHAELSVIATAADEPSRPNDRLLDISLQAIANARTVDLSDVKERAAGSIYESLDTWPGEHYKLLAGLVMALEPKVVVEIGTAKGAATLSMRKYLKKGAKITTFDVSPKDKVGQFFRDSDFDGRLEQHIDDLTDYDTASKHAALLKSADIIFMDALKDGKMEYLFMENFERISLKKGTLIVFDDIKVWNMLRFWRELKYPKIDLTSFGHWSGTGMIEWL
ncbi:MAG: class I SAM-dependent methyltransferase [Candidatus Micrarchaeota archaeon]